MKGNFQSIGFEHSCAECRNLTCHSIHGSVVLECPLESCYVCADLPSINDEISRTYKHLCDLVRQRQKIVEKPRHDPIIHRLPVEILSSIFVSVKDAMIDFYFEEYSDVVVPKPRYRQPSQSPPLLVGAVCKQWREITLTTPRLWTDIIVNLSKCADGQSKMVRHWARRAGALSLDITIFITITKEEYLTLALEILSRVEGVLWALREVAVRWNDVALRMPGSFCYELLTDLQKIPAIGTLFLQDALNHGSFNDLKLQHPLRPRRLVSDCISTENIPFEWDRLVFVNISDADDDDILHILQYARNLRYCISIAKYHFANFESSPPTSLITNLSLIHLNVTCDIIGHVNLPSLQYLDYTLGQTILVESFDPLVEFIKRSCPPLDKFVLRIEVTREGAFPPFEKLPGITSLFIEYLDYVDGQDPSESWMYKFFQALARPSPPTILPHLEELKSSSVITWGSFWKSFSRLFWMGSNPAESDPASETSIAIRRPLSKVDISVYYLYTMPLDRETFLRLLEVRQSGVNLLIKNHGGGDLFEYMAQVYGVEL